MFKNQIQTSITKIIHYYISSKTSETYYMETEIEVTSLMLVFTIPSEINLREVRSLPLFEIFLKLYDRKN